MLVLMKTKKMERALREQLISWMRLLLLQARKKVPKNLTQMRMSDMLMVRYLQM